MAGTNSGLLDCGHIADAWPKPRAALALGMASGFVNDCHTPHNFFGKYFASPALITAGIAALLVNIFERHSG
jgi:hypothetical protein